jgi:HlyD family secretion protein
MPEDNNRASIRSTAVNEIIAHKPGFLIRWGNFIFLAILLLILAASFFIHYPDIVPAAGRLLQSNTAACYAEVIVPQDKINSIKKGQKVLLKLAAYPFREYGIIEGRIDSIYTNAADSSCMVKVALINGLNTNYKKKLPYRDGLITDADIITADMRLSERLIQKLKKSF